MIKDCPKCGKTYGGSLVGAWAHRANPKDKVGYFGGYCVCGAKPGEDYVYYGFLKNFKKLYASEEKKFEDSLTDKKFKEVFGGNRKDTLCRFTYSESFIAKDSKEATCKIRNLWRHMKKDVRDRARLMRGYLYCDGKNLYSAHYDLVTAMSHEVVIQHLRIKRKPLGVSEWRP